MGSSFSHKKVPYVIMCDNFIEWQGMSTFTNKKSPSSVNICRRKLEFNFKMGDPFSSFVTIIPNTPLHLNLPVKYRPIYRSQWPRWKEWEILVCLTIYGTFGVTVFTLRMVPLFIIIVYKRRVDLQLYARQSVYGCLPGTPKDRPMCDWGSWQNTKSSKNHKHGKICSRRNWKLNLYNLMLTIHGILKTQEDILSCLYQDR